MSKVAYKEAAKPGLQDDDSNLESELSPSHLAALAPVYRPWQAFVQAGCGLVSYLVCILVLHKLNVGDPALEAQYHQEVEPATYSWPMIAFGTAFMLNAITLVFERESSKHQLAVLACYINLLAGINDFLSWKSWLPIVRDVWGQGQQLGRLIMWLHTTPTMVYLLGMISNFSTKQVALAMAMDIFMTVIGTAGQLVPSWPLSVVCHVVLFSSFLYVVRQMWRMFDSALSDARNDASVRSLKMLRLFTVGLWFLFPAIFLVVKSGLVRSVSVEEWLWTVGDFLGKVMFSSSLLQGNFLTIDERKMMTRRIVEEANRVQMIQELRELVEHKEKFMSGMSHELRTPLNGIIGLSEAILVGSCGDISEAVAKTISTIKNSGARLLSLINDILDAASMKQRKGSLTIKQEKVSLRRVVEDVLELCQPLARRGVKLVNTVPHGLPFVVGDTGRLIQIFHNLVGNSCKFTHAGTITVSATFKIDEVEVTVSDTGIGIPEDKFKSIFQAFEQVDLSTTQKYGGTGLGLNLVQQLVEAHGSAIKVRSKLGVGTTFFFPLKVWEPTRGEAHTPDVPSPSRQSTSMDGMPETKYNRAARKPSRQQLMSGPSDTAAAAAAEPHTLRSSIQRSAPSETVPSGAGGGAARPVVALAAAGATAAAAGQASPRARALSVHQQRSAVDARDVFMPVSVGAKVEVLSVDDDPVNQMVIQNLLAPAGYTIMQAMDGMEALDTLDELGHLPDIILLDVMMPGMSGYEVCRTLREKYPASSVPIIMISAKSKEEDIVEGLASGANDYVVKPFGRTEILARIATHLRGTRADLNVSQQGTPNNSTAAPKQGSPSPALTQLAEAAALTPSLPPSLKSRIQAGQANTPLVFDQLTLVAWQVVNLGPLQQRLGAEDLAVGLATLHSKVDELLVQCGNMYMPDLSDQQTYVAVAGLENEEQQVDDALRFAAALIDAASSVELPEGHKLHVAASLHTMAAQAVVIGSERPVLHVIGQLQHVVQQLLGAAADNCVLVSAKAKAAARTESAGELVQAGSIGTEPAYLLKVGQWQESQRAVTAACARLSPATSTINTDAVKLSPLQRSLMSLASASGSPAGMLALGAWPGQGQGATPSQSMPATPTNNAAAAVGSSEVAALQHDKQVLQRQLDEVSDEAARLQEEVDALTTQLNTPTPTPAPQADPGLVQQVQDLEQQLSATKAQLAAARAAPAKPPAQPPLHAPKAYQEDDVFKLLPMVDSPPRRVGDGIGANRSHSHLTSSMHDGQEGGSGASTPRAAGITMVGRAGQRSTAGSTIDSPGRLGSSLPAAAATDISVLLAELGMAELAPRFVAQQVSPDLVPLMDDAALKDLGVTSLGARVKLRLAAQGVLAAHT